MKSTGGFTMMVGALSLAIVLWLPRCAHCAWEDAKFADGEDQELEPETGTGSDAGAPLVQFTDEADFRAQLRDAERMVVMFFAPWCEHCKALEPEFQKTAENLQREGLHTRFAKIDATVEKGLASEYGIDGYPKVAYFVWGKHQGFYQTHPDAVHMTAAFKARELHSLTETPADRYRQFLNSTRPGEFAVVAHTAADSKRFRAYKDAVETMHHYSVSKLRFAAVRSEAGEEKLSMWRPGFKAPDRQTATFKGKWTGSGIAKWIKRGTYPTFGESWDSVRYDMWAIQDMHYSGVVVVIADEGLRPSALEVVRPLTSQFGNWLFTAAAAYQLGEIDARSLGVANRGPGVSMISVLLPSDCAAGDGHCWGHAIYALEGADRLGETGAVREFLTSVREKKAQRRYRTAPLPVHEVDKDGSVIVVGATFEKYAFDASRDVFVMFYDPKSQKCKEFMSEWKTLVQTAKKRGWTSKKLLLAKVDSTDNESPEEVVNVPKLVLYPAVQPKQKMKKRHVYRGKLLLDALLEFVTDNARSLEGGDEL